MDSALTASDVALLNNDGFGGGNNFIWVLALIFLFMFNGNRNIPCDIATTQGVQDGFNFAALERQNNEIIAAVEANAGEVVAAIKDGNFNLLGEIRDLQTQMSSCCNDMQKTGCEILRSIDGVNYNGALNKADIIAAIHAEGEETRKQYTADRMADMQNRINQLELQSAMCGVVRYPNQMAYNAGTSPFCGCNSCSAM